MEERHATTAIVGNGNTAIANSGSTAVAGNTVNYNDSAVILRFLEIIADQNRVIAQLQGDLLQARWQLAQRMIHQ